VDNNVAWEIVRKNSLGYYELKKHKPRFHEVRSKLLVRRKQTKSQWLEDPTQINGDKLNDRNREARRHFGNKRRKMKDTINELVTHIENKNIRNLHKEIDEFKKGYQHEMISLLIPTRF
jgi:hypothetical protein